MNERQNTVVATAAVALVLVLVFLCPWRVESSEEIKFSPIYQPPISYVRSYDGGRREGRITQFKYDDAEIAIDILALEVLAVGMVGGVLYALNADPIDSGSEDESDASQPRPLS